jgi:DNA-binding MarR family transcriptional regulator
LICIRHLSLVGPSTHSQLAEAASLSKPTITGIVDRLEARGVVTRDRTAEDRRHVLVRLTEAGRELAFTAPLPLQERFAGNLARLSRAEQGEIDRMLGRISQMMEVAELDAAPILEVSHAVAEAGGADPEPPAQGSRRRKSPRGATRSGS